MAHTAFVLAAGFGTRLRPLTTHRPKALVPVCGVPMLAYALALCARHGRDRVIVNAHHLAGALTPWNGRHLGCDVEVRTELPTILGTGGGLRAVRDDLAEVVTVVNADVLCDVDLAALAQAVPPGGAALALRPHADDAARYGPVLADAEGRIVQLSSVATAPGQGLPGTHFTGIHALHRAALGRVPDGHACIVRSAYAELVGEGRLQGVRHDGTWLDVGDPGAYLAANLGALATTVALPLDPFAHAGFARGPRGTRGTPPRDVQIEGSVWVGHGARIGAGARLRDCIVGPGAVVPPGATLVRTVVWDGAVAPARARDAIVHDGGMLQVDAD